MPVLILLLAGCSGEAMIVSAQQPQVPTSVDVPAPGLTPTPVAASPQPQSTQTPTSAPSATPSPEPTSTPRPALIPDHVELVATQSSSFVSIEQWCAGSGSRIREAMIAVDQSTTFAPWPELVEALSLGVRHAPPQIAASVVNALVAFEEYFLVLFADVQRRGHDVTLTVTANGDTTNVRASGYIPVFPNVFDVPLEFLNSKEALAEAFYDIDEYNLAACGFEFARRPRPVPTPTPEPTATPTPVPTPDTEDIEAAVDNMREFGLSESDSLCLLGVFLDPDFDLDDDEALSRMAGDCLRGLFEAEIAKMGFDPDQSSCIVDAMMEPGADWGDTEANQAAIRLCAPGWTEDDLPDLATPPPVIPTPTPTPTE